MKSKMFRAISFLIFIVSGGFALSISAQPPQQPQAVRVSGKTVGLINYGDSVHPKISPDGRQIAFSTVVVRAGMELTAITVRNLDTHLTTILLTPQSSKKYAAFSAFVSKIQWLDNNRLTAFISDGDVDSTILTFNVRTRRIVNTEHSGAGDETEDLFPISPDLKFAVEPIQIISPALPQNVVETALQFGNGAFAVEKNRGVVLQHRYAKYDDHIRFFDFQNKTEKTLLQVTKTVDKTARLLGGFTVGEKIVFALGDDGFVRVFEHQANETKLLSEQKFDDMAEFEIKYQTPGKILFLIKPYSNTSEVRSLLWLYDAKGLKKATDVANLLDVDVGGNRIAFCYWADKEKRHIIVKELNLSGGAADFRPNRIQLLR
ncbi:MAG TPA: hypothetical protein VK400_20275 [Pyrinomonadaceae bacterium]|nr:hypothetical protein [Pyrinomonadaceae bacterium]